MKEYTTDKIRNIGIVGHGSTGKTSLVEAALYVGKAISRLGNIDSGNTVSDYAIDEIDRKISINTALAHFDWKDCKINLIDMPGYADFYGELYGGLRAADTALIVINGVTGVEVGTDIVWRIASDYNIPCAFFINRMDKEHADYMKCVNDIREIYSNHAVPIVISWGDGLSFKGIIDLLSMKAYSFDKDGSAKPQDIPAEFKDTAQEWHDKMIEAAAESDEALMEKFFEAETLSDDETIAGLSKGIADRSLYPIFCGSATTLAGISPFLDKVIKILPAPDYAGEIKGFDGDKEVSRKISSKEKTSMLVFKTVSEAHVGELSFFKVFSGSIKPGDDLINTTKDNAERIGQIFALNGKERIEITSVAAGDIGALVKLKSTHTGDSLAEKRSPIKFAPIDFPKPVIQMAVVAKTKGDEDKIGAGLTKLREEDPTIEMYVDSELRQTVLSGQGELHLAVVTDRLKRKFGVEIDLAKPRIPYRSAFRKKLEVQGKFKRQSGGRGQYGDCWLRLEPLPRGGDFEFVNAIVGGNIPSKYLPAVEKGILEARDNGGLAATKVVDFKVTCYDGSYHTVDSSDMAFKIAASMGFKSGFTQADPYLLEPIFKIEVVVPEDYMGDVMGDISSRRGKIMGMDPEGKNQRIRASVPQAELYKYSTTLRSLTQGRGTYSCEFSHHEEVPREISEKVIEEIEREKEQDEKEK
ncbi:MAG: elongation factor G [candidate division Zixibacteria bacterium]|nr:elongation factor G [candidate division Zixibacteria bacterium]